MQTIDDLGLCMGPGEREFTYTVSNIFTKN